MALRLQTKNAEVPNDAIKLTEDQALVYYMKLVKTWDNLGDV